MANNLSYPQMETGSILGALAFVRIRADAEDIRKLAATVDDANLPAIAAASDVVARIVHFITTFHAEPRRTINHPDTSTTLLP